MSDSPILIIGAGPAGTRAAETLVRHGERPIVIDDQPNSGGQIYRRQPPGFLRSAKSLYGFEAAKATDLHQTFDNLKAKIDYRPGTFVWNVDGNNALTLGPDGVGRVQFRTLLLTTGAMDRIIPFPGWTLPGVYTMGGSQVALKSQGCGIGDPVVFMGTSPLLYLVAVQYVMAGANVAAVLDTARLTDALPVLGGLLAGRGTLLKGIWYQNWLRLKGVTVRGGITPIAAEGTDHIEAIRYKTARDRKSVV